MFQLEDLKILEQCSDPEVSSLNIPSGDVKIAIENGDL